jgi:hypothetical protein
MGDKVKIMANKTPNANPLKPGQIVHITSSGMPKASEVIILRTYTDGDFRAVPCNTEVGKKLQELVEAGGDNQAGLLALKVEAEARSRIFTPSEIMKAAQ